MTWLIYVFAAYLTACYLWAIYLAVRLYTGKRLRVLLFGGRGPQQTQAMLSSPPQSAAVQPRRRAA